jgi:hypothetical protein
MGYDWKGWSVLFYLFSALFGVFTAINPADYGLSLIAYKWVMLLIAIGMGFTGKMGASWAGKTNGVAKLLVPFVMLGALSAAACHPPVSIETEPGKKAWYAEQVLQRIEEVQNITIQLSKGNPPAISIETARLIVQFCVSSAKVVGEMPEGYAKVILKAFQEVKLKLPPEVAANPSLVTALAILEGVLTTIAGGQP